ncbi:MAG: heparinase II/III family protein [Alphaproteobacteria bacterium]|nr:heparinase II/III family protein [Alphaproteobacteria bacterium]
MPRLSLGERARVTWLAGERARRRIVSRALSSRLLRWRYGSTIADQLLIIPQDLRTRDPSFWQEVQVDQFGLAGSLAILSGQSPFTVRPPSESWERALHGFGWLRHLEANEEREAQEAARRLAVEWAAKYRGGGGGIPWRPEVIARRLYSWITHAGYLLEDADAKTYDVISECLGFQLVRLSATWRTAPVGPPRLLSLMAMVLGDLTIADHERQLSDAERLLATELARQILPDGGHISRNPAILVELLLDLLPLSQCFVARNRPVPKEMSEAIRRALGMLRFMRMNDGSLARFNGTGLADPAHIATVLAYGPGGGKPLRDAATQSGYVRFEAGRTLLVCDVGGPPALEYAGTAHAGCLSFELGHGSQLIFVNGGAPRARETGWMTKARATVSQNTLCLGEKSSSKMVRHPFLEDLVGAYPIRFPNVVKSKVSLPGDENFKGFMLEARHDGYMHRFSLMHSRTLRLSENGLRLEGIDRIEGKSGVVRLKFDLPFSIHFHLHPDVGASEETGEGYVLLDLPDGTAWRFRASGARLAIEEGIYFADSAGPMRARQIVLRGTTFGQSEVTWSLNGD